MVDRSHAEAIARRLAVMAEYYGKTLSTAAIRLIVEDLAAHSLEDIDRALTLHRRDPERGRFFPLTADLRVYLSGNIEDEARAAWDRALAAAARHGKYTGIAFDDRRITACIAGMGGWVRFCAMTHDELPFRARDFVERYASMARTNQISDAPASLPGMNTDGAITLIGQQPDATQALPEPVNVENLHRLSSLASGVGKGAA